jgi:GTP-binding protein Era
MDILKPMLPENPAPLFPEEQYTTQTLREWAEELILEQCFTLYHQEVPYGLAVKVNRFIEDEGPTTKIYADIWVEKENHKPIVVGKEGRSIRQLGIRSRKSLENHLGKVHLELFVKVKKNWTREKTHLRELGYVQSK